MSSKTSIVLLLPSLELGGTERQVVTLAGALDRRGVPIQVLTFHPGGPLRRELEWAGVPVTDLGKRGRWDLLPFVFRLFRCLRHKRPSIVYSFLPVANVLAVSLKSFLPETKVVWGVRASNMHFDRYDRLSRLVFRLAFRLEAYMSRRADLILANSQAGKYYRVAHGFPEGRIVVVPNGIDVIRFNRSDPGRHKVRAEWGVTEEDVLIGIVARLDPVKDHHSFLMAAARVSQANTSLRFACIGDGAPPRRAELTALAARMGLERQLVWAGTRHDMPDVYSALDVLVSSSLGEGFSNAIGEAMACCVLCVVTDVGDSKWIVGDTGEVVPAQDIEALARALASIAQLSREERVRRGARARERIEQHFSVEAMTERTLGVLETLR